MKRLLRLLDRERLQSAVRKGDRILLAVSGGADSMAMFHALGEWLGPAAQESMEVVHVNHLVRGSASADDAEFVAGACQQAAVTFHYREIAPLARKPRGVTTEEYFRGERHRLIAEVAIERGIRIVALGHNADDLAETFLMHMLRGTGLRGLTARFETPLGPLRLIRPLWHTPRQEIVKALLQEDLEWREDSSNNSMEFTRNRVRHLIIPMLARELNPQVSAALLRAAGFLADAESFISTQAALRLRLWEREAGGDGHSLPVDRLSRQNPALQAAILAEWMKTHTGISPDSRHIEAMLGLLRKPSRRGVRVGGPWKVANAPGSLVLMRATGHATDTADSLADADRAADEALARRHMAQHPTLPLARIARPIALDSVSRGAVQSCDIVLLDGRRVELSISQRVESELLAAAAAPAAGPLCLRNRMRGDRVSPKRRLKQWLINEKVPYFVRDYLLVVADPSGFIHAVAGLDAINKRLAEVGTGIDIALQTPRKRRRQ